MNAKQTNWTTKALLIGLAGLISACVPAGDFCEVVRGPIEFAPETAAQVVRTDRPAAEQIAAQNKYGGNNCDW